jgi:hypothetical protein
LKNLRNQRLQGLKTIAVHDKHEYRNRKRLQVLLKLDMLIGGEDDVEGRRGLSKQRAISQTRPLHVGDRLSIMPDEQTG